MPDCFTADRARSSSASDRTKTPNSWGATPSFARSETHSLTAPTSSASVSSTRISGGGPLNTETVSLRSSVLPSTSDDFRPEQPVRLHPDLVRRSVVDPQRPRPAADIHAEGLPRERLLEDALPEVAGEEQRVLRRRRRAREEAQLRDAEVLRLVHHGEVEGRVLAFGKRCGQRREHARTGDDLPRQQAGSDPLEDRPQDRPLRLGQPRLSTEPGDVAVGLPGVQLPRINDLLPLGQQEMRAELVVRPRGLRRHATGLARPHAWPDVAGRRATL